MIRSKPFYRYTLLVVILTLSLCLLGPAVSLAVSAEESHGTGEAATHDAGEGGHGGIPAAKVWDLVFRTMNFLAMIIILVVLLRKPAGQFFGKRREEIAQTLSDLELKKAESEEQYLKLERKLIDLDSEREAIIAEYIKDGEKEKEKIIVNAREIAARIQQQAEVAIKQEVQQAKAELKREIADLAASQAEEIIKNNIDAQDQERLVEEYLDKVVPN
ncbi:MAG: ATP synthase F0 subunit B [Deltaproteobacteria bacterium]|nr:ATP synthase F0 subunit B [Deltaproteobacteria bacterium]MBW2052010.1 ATP synthase F0 subunit B [Deltaproteobacteria bacterium]MBW2139960.1 ATP synthase F0 subunit B [Deltaproteobacteria bacterium]